MKIYSVFIINEISGDIESCITSDAPISSSMIPSHKPYQTPIKTVPPTPTITYRHCFCEFDSGSFCRGREALEQTKMSSKKKTATVKLKASSTLSNIKETDEQTMKTEHDAREKQIKTQEINKILEGMSNGK